MLRNRTVHVSRTLMVKELSRLLSVVPVDADYEAYVHAVLVENVLLKRTVSNREKTLRFLRELYALDPANPVFCALSRLWREEPSDEGRSLLALLAALYRDEVLRPTYQVVRSASPGDELSKHDFANAVQEAYPGRFGEASREKIGRNIAATWTQSGHLSGRYTKTRALVVPTPTTAAFAFFLGWLDGERGLRLYETAWASVLDVDEWALDELVFRASQRGWATYKRLGDVVEIDLAPLARPCFGSEE